MKQEDPAKKSSKKAILQHNGSQHPPHYDKDAITLGGDSHSTSADSSPIFIYTLLGMGKKHSIPKAASGDTFNTNTTYVYSPSVNYTSSQSMRPLTLLVLVLGMALALIATTQVVVLLYIMPQLPMSNVAAGTPTTTIPLPQQPVGPPEKHDYVLDHSHEQTPETASTFTFLARSSTQVARRKEIHDKRDILVTPNRNPEDGMELNPHTVDIKSYNESNATASNSQVASVRAGISEGGEVKVKNGSHDGRKKASKGGKVGGTSNGKILGGKKKNAHAESLHKCSYPIEHSSFDPPNTRLTSQVVALTPTNHLTLSYPHLLQNTPKIEQQSLQEHVSSKCHQSILFHPQVGEQRGNLPSTSTQHKYAVVPTPLNHPPELDIHGLSPQVSVPIDTLDTPISKFNKCTQRTRDKHVPCHAPTVLSEVKTHRSTQLLPTQLPQPQLNEDWLDSRTLPDSSFSKQCPWHEVLYLPSLHPAKATSLATLAFLDYQPVLPASLPKMKVINTGIDKHPDNTSFTSMDSVEGSTGGLWQEESSKWAPCRPSGHDGRDFPKIGTTVDSKENKREEKEGGEKQSLCIARCDICKSPTQTKSPQESSPQSNPQVAIDEKELAIATEKNSSCYINFYPTNQVSVSINTSSLEPPQCHPPSQHISEDTEHPLKFRSQLKICYHPSWKNLCVPMPFTKHCFHPFTWIFYDNGSIPPLHLEDLYEHTLAQSPYQKQEHPLTAPQALPQPSTTNTLLRIQDVADYSLSGLLFALILLCFHSCRRPIAVRGDSSSVDICTTGYPHPQEYFPESTHFIEHQKALSDRSQGKQQSSCPPNECTTSSDYEQTEIETLNTESTSFISGSTEAETEEMPWKLPISESGDGDKKQSEVAGIQEYICPPVVNVKDPGKNDTIKSFTTIETYSQPTTFHEVHKDGGELTVTLTDKKTIQWVQEKSYHPDLSELISPKLQLIIMDQFTSSRVGMLVFQKSNKKCDPG